MKSKRQNFDVEIRNVKLSKKSKQAIKKWEKECKKNKIELRSLSQDTVWDIESGHWYGPVPSHEFIDMKVVWENGYHDFFDIPADVLVEIDCFDTGILSFEKGIYPVYH